MKKVYFKKRIKALFNVVVTNEKDKEHIWYFNIAIAIYMIHNFSFYITLNLDNQTINIKTINDIILRI